MSENVRSQESSNTVEPNSWQVLVNKVKKMAYGPYMGGGFNIRLIFGYQRGADMLVGPKIWDFDTMFVSTQTALVSMKRGSGKPLVISCSSRGPRIPDTPAFPEAGFLETGTFGTVIRAVAALPKSP
jgi:hypothetical protein